MDGTAHQEFACEVVTTFERNQSMEALKLLMRTRPGVATVYRGADHQRTANALAALNSSFCRGCRHGVPVKIAWNRSGLV